MKSIQELEAELEAVKRLIPGDAAILDRICTTHGWQWHEAFTVHRLPAARELVKNGVPKTRVAKLLKFSLRTLFRQLKK